MLRLLDQLPLFYRAGNHQVFVHAGVDEDAGEWWPHTTTHDNATRQFPARLGAFEVDVIAGRVSVAFLLELRTITRSSTTEPATTTLIATSKKWGESEYSPPEVSVTSFSQGEQCTNGEHLSNTDEARNSSWLTSPPGMVNVQTVIRRMSS